MNRTPNGRPICTVDTIVDTMMSNGHSAIVGTVDAMDIATMTLIDEGGRYVK